MESELILSRCLCVCVHAETDGLCKWQIHRYSPWARSARLSTRLVR